ncbi:MAG TPA: carboxypeptidase-like regulatory domain-containing protein [Acidobacteriota bacterium]|nr:carboxypeptidase-like regulatory domain-containing protein [Acidobacteriota bacterium]
MTVNELKRITKILAGIVVFIVSCQAQPATAESSIYGKVTTLRGQPINNVVVRFYKLLPEKAGGGEKLISEVTSDESGHYEAKDLDWGHYRIHFGGRPPSFNDEDVYGFFVSNGSKRMLDVALAGGMPAHQGAISKVRGMVTDGAGEPTGWSYRGDRAPLWTQSIQATAYQ